MAASKHVKITGLPELIAKFKELGSTKEIEAISYRGTFGAAKDLKLLVHANILTMLEAPDDSGATARAIAQKRIARGTQRGYSVGMRAGRMAKNFKSTKPKGFMGPMQPGAGEAADNPFYWRYVEFGTRYITAVGFFRKAIAMWQPRAVRTVQTAGAKAVLSSGNAALKKIGNGKK